MRKRRAAYRALGGRGGGNLRERNHLEELSIDGKIMSKWFFKQWDGAWTGFV